MKFTISMNNLTEGANGVFAFCDFTTVWQNVGYLADYQNWQNYVTFGGRVGGFMINDFWVEKQCIEEGIAGEMGYDVGNCAGEMVSTTFDTKL